MCTSDRDDPNLLQLTGALADYEACLMACQDEAQLRTVWALPYLEAGVAVPPIPEDLVDLWR